MAETVASIVDSARLSLDSPHEDTIKVLPEYKFVHQDLGEIVGLARNSEIVQFRGIPYATIPGRFRQSILAERLPSQPFHAVQPGPICPQPTLPFPDFWEKVPLAEVPQFIYPGQDEFGCLNLSITVHRTALVGVDFHAVKLPVLLFIHGGAFVGGSQSVQVGGREIYDGANLVQHSLARNKEIIVVTLNYRVGPLGFLAATQLSEFNKSHDEPVGNYGLHDQRQAIRWIHKFIQGFGGDPENITVSGTSAGGVSCHFQTVHPERTFKRAICSSATMLGLGPMPLEHHQSIFNIFGDVFAAKQEDTVSAMQEVPVQAFVNTIPIPVFSALLDGSWITPDVVSGRHNIEPCDMMIGACDYEMDIGTLLLSDIADFRNLKNLEPKSDEDILRTAEFLVASSGIVDSLSETILRAYSISTSAAEHPNEAFLSWVQMASDLVFRIPYVKVGRSAVDIPANILLYEFKATNPFSDQDLWHDKANHGVNDLFVFDVARDLVPEKYQQQWAESVDDVRRCWINFCHGEMPWPAYNKSRGEEPIYVFANGKNGRLAFGLEKAVGEDVARRWETALASEE